MAGRKGDVDQRARRNEPEARGAQHPAAVVPGRFVVASIPVGEFTWADLVATVSVAALLVPESMGYATVAGVPAQIGLYATPLALVGYALFGGSRLNRR